MAGAVICAKHVMIPEKLSVRKNSKSARRSRNACALFWRIGMPSMPDLDVWNFYSNYRGRAPTVTIYEYAK